MKKLIFSIAIVALLLPGCAPGGAFTPDPTPTPTAAPTPTPQPVVAVFAAETHRQFYEGLRAGLGPDGTSVEARPEGLKGTKSFAPAGRSAVIAYLDGDGGAEALSGLAGDGIPVLVYAPGGQEIPKGAKALTYDPAGSDEKALDLLLGCENHDTPVRLVGLFTGEDSAAFEAFEAGIEAGRVLRKGVYIDGTMERSLGEWIADRIASTAPGTLDGIYAETAEGALMATEAIVAAGLTGVEVTCPEVTDDLLDAMRAHPDVFAYAVGADEAFAGRYLRAQAVRLLIGLAVEDEATLLPEVFAAGTPLEGMTVAAPEEDETPGPTPTPDETPGSTDQPAAGATVAPAQTPTVAEN